MDNEFQSDVLFKILSLLCEKRRKDLPIVIRWVLQPLALVLWNGAWRCDATLWLNVRQNAYSRTVCSQQEMGGTPLIIAAHPVAPRSSLIVCCAQYPLSRHAIDAVQPTRSSSHPRTWTERCFEKPGRSKIKDTFPPTRRLSPRTWIKALSLAGCASSKL